MAFNETPTDWTAMKRFAIQTKLVRTKKTKEDSEPTMADSLGESSARIVNDLAKDFLKYAAATVVGAYAVIKLTDTLSQIAVKKTRDPNKD